MTRNGARGHSWLRDHVDDVVVRVETIEGPRSGPLEILEIRLPGETAPSHAQIVSELERLIDTDDSPLLGHPYLLRMQRDVISWGASGAVEQIVLQLADWAAEGAVARAGWEAVRATTGRIISMVRSNTELLPQQPLDREEALARADWAVRERFGLPPALDWLEDGTEVIDESLCLTGEEHASVGEFQFTWEHNGVGYEARVSQAGQDIQTLWMRRFDLR